MIHDRAVSEIVGALALIAVISLAVSMVGVVILSSVETAEVPSVSVRITNASRTIYILHEGGDSLPAGTYRILADGSDRTGSFSDAATGADAASTEFKAGTILQSDGFADMPGTVMLVFRGQDNIEAVLVTRYFV